MIKQEFDSDQLCMLVHLGLWESAKFYAAERYTDFYIHARTFNNQLLCSYYYHRKNDYTFIFLALS